MNSRIAPAKEDVNELESRHFSPSVQVSFAEIVQRRVQNGRDNDRWFRSVILKKANSPPRITARRGGGVTKKMARSLLIDAAGEVFLVPSIGTPPRPRESGRCAIFS
jgi:hypothetical protein